MPGVARPAQRAERGGGREVVVRGLYGASLEWEREKCGDRRGIDPRWKRLQHPNNPVGRWCGSSGVVCEHDPAPAKYRRPRYLLDALEAGWPVVVNNSLLHGHSLRHLSVRVPWKLTQVHYVRVWPDDVVAPARLRR